MFKLCIHCRAINETFSLFFFLSSCAGKSYQNLPLCTKCQVFAHIAEGTEKFYLQSHIRKYNLTVLLHNTQNILVNTSFFSKHFHPPCLAGDLRTGITNPVQVKQSEGEKVVHPLCCCLASWRVYYSMLLSVNLARSFILSVSCLSVRFH